MEIKATARNNVNGQSYLTTLEIDTEELNTEETDATEVNND
jgi:hypothetical protein